MIDTLRFNIEPSGIEVYEIHHCSILAEMFNFQKKPFDWTKKDSLLNHYRDLIQTVFAPYEKEYDIRVYGSHIAIDRTKKNSAHKNVRLGVIGVTHIPE